MQICADVNDIVAIMFHKSCIDEQNQFTKFFNKNNTKKPNVQNCDHGPVMFSWQY